LEKGIFSLISSPQPLVTFYLIIPLSLFWTKKDWYGAGIFAPSGRKYLQMVIGRCVGGEKYKKEWRESMLITVSS